MSLRDSYRRDVQRARADYGESTAVLYQVGSFYELYDEEAARFAAAFDLVVNDKHTAGFPVGSLERRCPMATSSGCTVVCMDQLAKPKKNGVLEYRRVVTRVFSPGAPYSRPQGADAVLSACVYLGSAGGAIGYATVDVFTGRTQAAEFLGGCAADALGMLYSALLADAPRESCVVFPDTPAGHAAMELVRSHVVAGKALGCLVHEQAVDPVTLKQHHIEETLRKQFDGCGLLGGATSSFVGLDGRPHALRAFAHLIHFLYRRDPRMLRVLSVPEFVAPEDRLDIAIGGLQQLDIVDEAAGLIAHLPRCVTAAGRRALHGRITRPSSSTAEIRRQLDTVGRVLESRAEVRRLLAHVSDIEFLAKKMCIPGAFKPPMWPVLARSLRALAAALLLVAGEGPMCEAAAPATDLVLEIERTVDLAAAERATGATFGNVLVPGHAPELDSDEQSLRTGEGEVRALVEELNACAGCMTGMGEEKFKTEVNREGETQILVTQTRFGNARKEILRRRAVCWVMGRSVPVAELTAVQTGTGRTNRASRLVQHPELTAALEKLADLRQEVWGAAAGAHSQACETFYRRCAGRLSECQRVLADLDVACVSAVAAADRGFVRPELVDHPVSFVEAEHLRHPVVEALDPLVAYVGNDIRLDDEASGMLLFGINGSGKSCLMKSLGVAVVMAQAGMYVAASRLRLAPFRKLFTRIWNNDDILRGLSTFMVEMTELNEIMRRCDAGSLVLGDELCSGTERFSATSIITAAVHYLRARGCRFLLATHQHDVVTGGGDIAGVQVCHLGVTNRDGLLVYDRRIQPGHGETRYGIEVCASLGMPPDFLEGCRRTLRSMLDADTEYAVAAKVSRYNSRVSVDVCGACGAAAATETHHLLPQSEAPAHLKHRRHNLQPLCEACHAKAHRTDSLVMGRVTTSRGIQFMPLADIRAQLA